MTRIDSLLDQLAHHRQGLEVEGYRGHRHYFCPDEFLTRERLYVAALEQHRAEPRPLARAYALAHVLEHMPVRIVPGELIVGSKLGCYVNTAALSPEQHQELDCLRMRKAEAQPMPPVELSAEQRAGMAAKLYSAGGCTGHCVPDYASVLDQGFEGILSRVREQATQVAADSAEGVFLQSVDVVLRAGIRFAERYGAQAQAGPAGDGREMAAVADRCRRVPRAAAQTFHDAVQSLWFAHVILCHEALASAVSPGRLDQLLWPHYQRDITTGRLTPEQAQELVECLWIKLQEAGESQNVTLGGTTLDNADAANELTALMLDATRRLRLPQPSVTVRVHPASPDWVFHKIADMAKASTGQPSVFNDTVAVEALKQGGVEPADARDYAIVGCYEPVPAGKANSWTVGGNVFLPKCLEFAMNEGACMDAGHRAGAATPSRDALRDFDALLQSFYAQVSHAIRLLVQTRQAYWEQFAAFDARPYESALRRDCIEARRDLCAGGARYNAMCCCGIGLANAADGLAALRQCVYEDRTASLDEVFHAMRDNFEGWEQLRLALEAAPKYGNDHAAADSLAAAIGERFCREALSYRTPEGVSYWPTLGMYMAHIAGSSIGAGPDGRRRGETLALGAGPATGRGRHGPTALLRSVARLPHALCPNGSNFVILSVPPSTLSSEEGAAKFGAMVKTYLELGGQHLMFHVVDAATLRDAKLDPRAHRDLLVRISGLSAYFIHLDPSLQDEIICRTGTG